MKTTNQSIILSTYFGHFLVSFDAFCYALLIYRVSPLFFPFEEIGAYISGISLFAMGMIVKPFGGLLYGYLIENKGYRVGLLTSSSVFCLSALGLICLETYQDVGWCAPIALILFRLLLGLSSAVEYGSGISLISEYLQKRKNFAGSLLMTFGTFSALIAQILILWLFVKDVAPLNAFKVIYGAFAGKCRN